MSSHTLSARRKRAPNYTRASTRVAEVYPRSNEYPLGTRLDTVLRYSHYAIASTAAAGGFASHSFNLNSLFDPDRTGTGHQPKGFDQMATFFNRYVVTRCDLTWQIKGVGTTTPDTHVAFLPHNDTTIPSDFTSMVESPGSKFCTVGYGAPAEHINNSIALYKLNGTTKPIYLADDRFQATISNSPSELLLGTLGFQNPGGAISQFQYSLLMEFHCTFFDPVVQGSSISRPLSLGLLPPSLKSASQSTSPPTGSDGYISVTECRHCESRVDSCVPKRPQ